MASVSKRISRQNRQYTARPRGQRCGCRKFPLAWPPAGQADFSDEQQVRAVLTRLAELEAEKAKKAA